MNDETFMKISSFADVRIYVNSRAANFMDMDCLGRPNPTSLDGYVLAFMNGVHTAVRHVPPDDPGASPADGPGVREAKELYRRARRACLHSDLGRPDRELASEVAAAIGPAAASGGTSALRWLLCAAALTARAKRSCAELASAVLELPQEDSHAGELLFALSSLAHRELSELRPVRASKLLARGFERGAAERLGTSPDPLGSFGAYMIYAAVPKPPRYGPGASLPGRAGGIANALSLARALPEPAGSAVFPAFLLSDIDILKSPEEHRLWRAGMRDAAALGLPESPAFRLGWETLDLALSFADERLGGRAARDRILESFSGMAARGLFRSFGTPRGPVMSAMATVCEYLSVRLADLDTDGLDRAVRIAAPLRASGELPPWAFTELFREPWKKDAGAFQHILMRSGADGLFGKGEALVHAVSNAACFSGPSAAALAGFRPEARKLARLGGTDSVPGSYGARLAAATVAAQKAALDGSGRTEAFRALASLSPDSPDFRGPPLFPDSSADAARRLHLHAFCSALLPAVWTMSNDPEADVMTAALLKLLPERSLLEPVFLDTILPGAANASFGKFDDKFLSLQFLRASMPALQAVKGGRLATRILETLSFWMLLTINNQFGRDALSVLRRDSLRALAGPLPPALRAGLVSALVAAHGLLGLKDEAEMLFLENALMLLPARRPLPAGAPLRNPELGIPGDPGRDVSWPWPPVPEEGEAPPGRRKGPARTRVPDPALEEAAALAGGMSPEGWGDLRSWIPARLAMLEKSSPKAAAERRMKDGGRRLTVTLGDLESADDDEWKATADYLIRCGERSDDELSAYTTLPQIGRILLVAPPRDRIGILADATATLVPQPPLKAGDGAVIVTLDRANPHPLAAAGIVLAGLGRFQTAFECLVRDTRPWFLADLKADALARVLESDRAGAPWLKGRTAGLERLYSGWVTVPGLLERIRKALSPPADKSPGRGGSPPSGPGDSPGGQLPAPAPAVTAAKAGSPDKGRGAGKSRAARKGKGAKGGKGGGKRG
ncbi:MAG: hypothetical protein LBQ79_08560 [Deltaproteobacteria bacterium]|nr:hypothetical protein [Deltaproteobacteria bacterium]